MKGFVLMIAAGIAAILGVLAGTMPVQVRDHGELISCGPAVLGNGSRLAELACADISAPLQTTAVAAQTAIRRSAATGVCQSLPTIVSQGIL